MRRVHLRHRDNILKRILIQYAALNRLILRNNFGNGTPRGLQGQYVAALFTLILLWSHYQSLSFILNTPDTISTLFRLGRHP